ncbi:MAG: arabinose efflux permease family protein [Candidatus Bathyarchaeota archaeon B23]|nr:MAG: arabinose efflux permease family protein [Candidatus Bathyarchaeota archaeon B23]
MGRLLPQEGNIRVLALQTVFSQLGFGMFYVVWQPYLLSIGVSVVELGLVQTAINLSSAAGSLLWGLLSDEVGRKPIIVVSYFCRVLSMALLLLSGSPLFLYLFAFLLGFSAYYMQGNPARGALVSESVERERRATAISVLMSISLATSTVASSAGGYIALKVGYHPIFYLCILCDLLGVLLIHLFVRETLRERVRRMRGWLRGLEASLKPEGGLLPLYLIVVLQGVGYSAGYSLFYGLLVDHYGFTTLELGFLSTAFNLAWALSSIPLGRLSDRLGRKPLLLSSWTAALVAAVGFLLSRSLWMFLLFQVVSALDPAMWIPAWMALVSEKTPSTSLSSALGRLTSYSRLAGIPAPYIASLLYTHHGFSAPLLLHVAILLLTALLILSVEEGAPSS